MKTNQLKKIDTTSAGNPRRPYQKPTLGVLGDLRSLTLGGSIGAGESGGAPRKVKLSIQPGDFSPHGYPVGPDGAPLVPPSGPSNP